VLAGSFTGKRSEHWLPTGSLHNFMHAKIVVADDVVFAGSFNLSHSGEKNAENVLELEDPGLARQLSSYVDEVRALYPPVASDVMSSTTRFTAGTSFTIRDEIVSSRSYGSRAQSAVIASSLVTARTTTG